MGSSAKLVSFYKGNQNFPGNGTQQNSLPFWPFFSQDTVTRPPPAPRRLGVGSTVSAGWLQ